MSLTTSRSRLHILVTFLMVGMTIMGISARNALAQQAPPPARPPVPIEEVPDFWKLGDEGIYNANGGNVGVGTSSPGYQLDILSTINIIARFGTNAADHSQVLITAPTGFDANLTLLQANTPQWFLGNRANNNRFGIREATGTTEVFSILQNGSVGVGTVAPGYRFDVQGGQINASGGLCIAGICKTAWSDLGASQWITTTGSNIYYSSGNVGIGTATPSSVLHLVSSDAANGQFRSTFDANNYLKFSTPANGLSTIYAGSSALVNENTALTLKIDNTGDLGGYFLFGIKDVSNTYKFQVSSDGSAIFAGNPTAPLFKSQIGSMTAYYGVVGTDSSNMGGIFAGGTASANQVLGSNSSGNNVFLSGNGAAGNLTFKTNGAARMFVSPSGNVGIATTVPAYRLDVQGGQINTSGGFCIAGVCKNAWSDIGSSQWTTIGSSIYYNTGNVGVGVSAPTEALQVRKDQNAATHLLLENATAGNAALVDFEARNNLGHLAQFGLYSSTTTSAGALSSGNAFTYTSSPAMVIMANNVSGLIKFATGGVSERMRIDASGNVGIGTASPAAQLHIAGANGPTDFTATPAPDALRVIGGVGGNGNWGASPGGVGGALYFAGGTGGTPVAGSQAAFGGKGGSINLLGGGGGPNIFTSVGGGAGGDILLNGGPGVANSDGNIILANLRGRVGIGSATPGYRLDVQGGQINASGGLCIAGVCKSTWSETGGSQWTTGASNVVYYNTGNVGIGTATPDSLARLHLAGSGGFGQDIQTTTNDWTRLRFVTPTRTWGFFLDGGSAGMGAGKFGLFDYTANAWRLVADTSGSLGIGTTTPNKSAVSRALTVNGVSDAIYELAIGDVRKGNMYHDGSNLWITNNASGATVLGTNNTERLRIDSTGNVGIGTAPTAKKLEVLGDLNASGTISGGNIVARYQDVAEWVESSQALPAGTVVVLDHTKSNQVVASFQSYDTRVAGVISAQPGITLGEKGASKVLVATTGRVKVKVDATAGSIQVGDLLVTSDIEGVAKKSQPLNLGGVQIHRPGTLIGKALEPLSTGTGEILVLLSLQ